MPPILSVIIPTHRRAPILALCLDRLARQTIADRLEVIVVSDGGDEETERVISEQRTANSAVRLINVPPCHQGTARNRGVQIATAPFTLFIGDDILLEEHACAVHVRTHTELGAAASEQRTAPLHRSSKSESRNPFIAVLGRTDWDPAVGITPVMRWLDRTGWQFGYARIAGHAHQALSQAIQHRFTYTSHISLPTDIARQLPFREDTSLYGWEDVEWGMRLRDAGVALLYEPHARALHHHRLTLDDSLKRMETIGRSAAAMARLDPRFDRTPRGWKRIAYACVSLLPTMRGRHAQAFLHGINSA